jgi:hypothetical protein
LRDIDVSACVGNDVVDVVVYVTLAYTQ